MRVKWAGWAAMVGGVGAAVAGTLLSVAPVAADPPDASVTRGTQVFQDNCEVCHGPYAQGKVGPPLIPIPAEIASQPIEAIRADLTGLVRGGIPGAMPAFEPSQLSDDDVAALADWFVYVNKVAPNGTTFYAATAPVQPGQSTRYAHLRRGDETFGFGCVQALLGRPWRRGAARQSDHRGIFRLRRNGRPWLRHATLRACAARISSGPGGQCERGDAVTHRQCGRSAPVALPDERPGRSTRWRARGRVARVP